MSLLIIGWMAWDHDHLPCTIFGTAFVFAPQDKTTLQSDVALFVADEQLANSHGVVAPKMYFRD